MKKTAYWLLGLAALAFVLALPLAVHADSVPPATVANTAPAVSTPTPAPAPVVIPWYANEALWSTLFAVAAGVFGIVRNSQLSTHQKINEALVLGIEQATKIPAVAAFENRIKADIQTRAAELGVQPVLHRIVQDLTEPAATNTGSPS